MTKEYSVTHHKERLRSVRAACVIRISAFRVFGDESRHGLPYRSFEWRGCFLAIWVATRSYSSHAFGVNSFFYFQK